MIIGIDPNLEKLDNPYTAYLELRQYKRIELTSNNVVSFYLQYNNAAAAGTATADYALGTIEADGTLTPRFFGNPNDSIIFNENDNIVEIDSTAFEPGDTLQLYPMLRFRNTSDAEWQIIPPATHYVDAGRADDGRFFITIHPYLLEVVDASLTSGHGRIGESQNITLTLRNPNDHDYAEIIYFCPYYYGNIAEEDVTADTPYTQGEMLRSGPNIRAGEEGKVTFSFTPEQGGLIKFKLQQVIGARVKYLSRYTFAFYTMRFDNDTVYSYNPYLANNSYVTHEGNHYVYHVELSDIPGVTLPYGVPSDSIFLDCRICSADQTFVNRIKIKDEIRDYLRALPENAGSGTYKFTAEVPLDIEQDGEYYVWSYLIEWLDAEHTKYIVCAEHFDGFSVVVDPTAIKNIDGSLDKDDAPFYDLQGRKLVAPKQKGIYIRKGKKVIR